MKTIGAEVFVTCPGRHRVTLKITTEGGLCSLGDATLNGREFSVVSCLKDHLCSPLVGRDARRTEAIWKLFCAYWRRGPVTMSAISTIDMALWDIKAKAANMPLYQRLFSTEKYLDFTPRLFDAARLEDGRWWNW